MKRHEGEPIPEMSQQCDEAVSAWHAYLTTKAHPTIYPKVIIDYGQPTLRTRKFSLVPSVAPELSGLQALMPDAHDKPNVYPEGTTPGSRVSMAEYLDNHDWFSLQDASESWSNRIVPANRRRLEQFDASIFGADLLLEIFFSDQWGRRRINLLGRYWTIPPVHQRSYLIYAAEGRVHCAALDMVGFRPITVRSGKPHELSLMTSVFKGVAQQVPGS